ncbi:hypothetical protein [Streptomyces sp. YIM B13508]|uniref:hypothetical protein n=1 Tax=Streptomyces sp. YIM B13508 TaxID=3366315 RepID=UPI003678265D
MSRVTRKVCEYCNRAVGDLSCREVKLGWYCLMRGLVMDDSKLIHPTPEPVGRAEQKIIDEYAPLIADAERLVDARLAAFTAAQNAHLSALLECARTGTGTGRWHVVGVNEDLDVPWGRRKRLSAREQQRLIDAEEAAREAFEAAEDALVREKQRLTRIENRYGMLRSRARDQDRAAA